MLKEYAGLYYNINIPQALIECLHYVRVNNIRIRILYGDHKLNTIWRHTECGYIHKTASLQPQPVILYNTGKFTGANQLLENCIMRIEYANKKDGGILYEYKHNQEL